LFIWLRQDSTRRKTRWKFASALGRTTSSTIHFGDLEGWRASALSKFKINDYVNIQLGGRAFPIYLAKYLFPYV
jgi:hypothetical protein